MMRSFIFTLLLIAVWPAHLCALELPPGASLTDQRLLNLIGMAESRGPGRRVQWRFLEPRLPLINQASVPVRIELVDSQFEERTGALTARMIATLESGENTRLSVHAIAAFERAIAVPTEDLEMGSIVASSDLQNIWLDERRLADNILVSPDELVGLEVKRRLLAGKPIRRNMLRPARLIERGELVEVEYSSGGLVLTISAEAVEDAGAGDLLRLRNLDSGNRIVARATGRRQATIERKVP